MRPRHLVLDEPTAQLDPAGTDLVGEAIARLAGHGISIIVVEHKTDLLARVADRVVVIDAGAVVRDGPAREVLADEALAGFGVLPPSEVRLRSRLAQEGLAPLDLDLAPPATAR